MPREDAAALVSADCRLLAIWPAPVNHDSCFERAGFTLFGDNGEDWDDAAEGLLQRVIEKLLRFGPIKLSGKPLGTSPPWYLRPFRAGRDLPLQQQALLPMHWDSLPAFHALFGDDGAALRTGNGHFLLWISLPAAEADASEFVRSVAAPWPIRETQLRWDGLLPGAARHSP